MRHSKHIVSAPGIHAGAWLALVVLLLLATACTSLERKKFDEGLELSKAGKHEQAAQAYLEALDAKPTFAEARLNLGAVLYKMGRPVQAEREFRMLLAEDPDYLQARENLAVVLEAIGGRDHEALQLWQGVLERGEKREDWAQRGQAAVARLEARLKKGGLSPAAPKITALDIDTVPAFNAKPRPIDLALVIGVETYQKLQPAAFARGDAELVYKYLLALGFQPRNIEVLTDQRATANGMKVAIESWLPNRAKPESRVFVYFSGHGSPDPRNGEAYIVPHDGDPAHLSETAYSLKTFYAKLGEVKAKEIIVALDSCFSGRGGRSVIAAGARPAVIPMDNPILASTNLAVLSAAQGVQISTSSPIKRHGIFTYYFLKALKEGKRDLLSVYHYIIPLVEDEAKLQHVDQTPVLQPVAEKVLGRYMLWDQP